MIEAEARIREALALCNFRGSIVSYDAAAFAQACSPHAIRDVLTVRDEREAKLTSELDALAKDAERYISLRDSLIRHGLLQHLPAATRPDDTYGPTWVLYPPRMIDGSKLIGWSATTADAAIDAQIEQERSEQAKAVEAR